MSGLGGRQPDASVVRVLSRAGRTAGVAVLVGPRHVITCAHVVNAALGRDRRTQERPSGDVVVGVEFPLLGAAQGRTARVACWVPPPQEGIAGDDIAGVLPDGSYKLAGDARGRLWWAIKLCRFEAGELDGHVPGIRALPLDAKIL